MIDNPIFIGGPDRCGKTTLRACLVSHPNISIPSVGSNMWSYFYGQYGDLSQDENVERLLAALLRYKHVRCLDPDPARLRYKHVRCLDPDPARLRREFAAGPRTYGRLFGLIQQHHAEREGKPRWGDQTGLIERYADVIFEEFPGAQMIHMIRDPRDRYYGSLELWPDGKGRAGGATARWLYSTRLAQRNLRRYPGRYLLVRFESLVRQPERTLREVCDFLGETYTPAMLSMDGAPEYREKRSHGHPLQPGESPLSEEYIGLYRGAIPPAELAFMQRFAAREMAAFDYQPEPLHFSAAERARLAAVDFPLNLARLMAWRVVEGVQQRAPGRFGRRPSSGMVLRESGASQPQLEGLGTRG